MNYKNEMSKSVTPVCLMFDNQIINNFTVSKIDKSCRKMTEYKELKLRLFTIIKLFVKEFTSPSGLPRLNESSLAVTGTFLPYTSLNMGDFKSPLEGRFGGAKTPSP
jgi:hypothetical protein